MEKRPRPRVTSRQVNLALEVLLAVSLVSGVGSWIAALDWARPFTFVHAVSGYSMILLMPLKIRGPVASGFKRGRVTRWISTVFGVMVVATISFGIAHSTGLWYGVGYWSALWTHLLFGFGLIPLAVWHVWSRPTRPTRADLGRRAFLSASGLAAAGAAAVVAQEALVGFGGLDGSSRAGTGSHERASFEPAAMPVVSWIDDKTPRQPLTSWTVTLDGADLPLADLAERARPLEAELDCTGGWRSTQNWEVVPLSDVLPDRSSRSVRVTSATGYSRLFARSDCDDVYLCTGYDGLPLSRGHGAPLRIVAPGRRGPWWVKWVTSIELTDRPAWLQLPFPTT